MRVGRSGFARRSSSIRTARAPMSRLGWATAVRRGEEVRPGEVVETAQGDVLGHGQAVGAQGAQRADRHGVVGGDQRGGARAEVQQCGRGTFGPGGLRVAVHQDPLVERQPRSRESVPVAGDPLGGRAESGQTGHQTDTAVSETGEMGDQAGRRLRALGADLVAKGRCAVTGWVDQPVQEDGRYTVPTQVREELAGLGEGATIMPSTRRSCSSWTTLRSCTGSSCGSAMRRLYPCSRAAASTPCRISVK